MESTATQYHDQIADMGVFPSFAFVAPHLHGKRVLDLGCGLGYYLKQFSADSVGVEVSVPSLAACRRQQLRVVGADLNQPLPFASEIFDGIFCSHVLEHVDAPILLLRECRRLLRPGGTLVVGVPTEGSISRLVDHYFRAHPGHLYSFSLDNLKVLLQKAGFRPQHTYIDLNLVRRFRLWPLLRLVQHVPSGWVLWGSHAYWIVSSPVPCGKQQH